MPHRNESNKIVGWLFACEDCWADEWGSAENETAKACRNSYFLACISADEMTEPEPDIAYISVPPSSLAAWDSYMVKRNKVLNLPALAFLTEVSFDDEVDYQKLHKEFLP